MSVADILEKLAENAGRGQLARGALIGNTIASAAAVPGQILDDREKERIRLRQQAQQDAIAGYAKNADTRATKDQALQDAAAQRDLEHKAVIRAGLTAGLNGSDPTGPLNTLAAFDAVKQLGKPEAITDVIAAHRAMAAKPIILKAGDVGVNPDTNQPIPGMSVPAAPTTAGNEAAIRGLYAKQASGQSLTPTETAAIKGYETEKGANDAPITVKTVENGKMVEKVLTRAQALAAGSFASQPPASVQIQNMPPPPAQPASKAEIAMANYMVPTPSPRSFATPTGKAMMDRILTVNPEFDASMYSVRAPTRKAFTTGVQGQQLTAMNTAIEHLDQLQAAADALKNGNFTPSNAIVQKLKETFGSNAPTNYDTIKNMVDKEVEAVANKGVPTVSGTAEQKALAGKKAGPEQIKGYIDTLIPLMGSKVNALHFQYKGAMGANDPFDPLTPEAKAILAKRGFDPAASPATGGGGLVSVTDPTGGVHQFPTQAQADAFKKAAGIKD